MNKTKFLLILLFIVIIIFFVFLLSYKDDSENKNYVRFVDSTERLEIESIFPITDYAGKMTEISKDGKNIYYSFKIKNYSNKNSKYRILLKEKKHKNSISDKYVKVLLSDGKDQILSKYDKDSYLTLDCLDKKENSYVLYKSSLASGKEETYILRLWISDNYKEDDLDKVFDSKLMIYSY